MDTNPNRFPSTPIAVFRGGRLPESAVPAGYSSLIDAFDLQVPLPETLCAIGSRHKVYEQDGWRIFTPRHQPEATLAGNLTFALRYEGLDLAILKRVFQATEPAQLAEVVKSKPASAYMRRVWFLFEWLMDEKLGIPDADTVPYADIVDPKFQWAVKGHTSKRHRVRNNLPGSRDFCPLVRRTEKIEGFVDMRLDERAKEITGKCPRALLARAASFLLLKDSRSSFAIEGESTSHTRIQRWGNAIGEAGRNPLDESEYLRLQEIVLGREERFTKRGFRTGGGFVGDHDPVTNQPVPDHVSARHEDLSDLMRGLAVYEQHSEEGLDPVIAAACLAFGFVYIHPFVDGNGRIHRYIIHHVLRARKFNPPDLVFPVSAAMHEQIDEYRRTLESYSFRLLPAIEWKAAPDMNVEVLNDTGDFYRYFDATRHTEFLFECVRQTIEHHLPEEISFLEAYDRFKSSLDALIEMPDSQVNLMFKFLRQNGGRFSKRMRTKEFSLLSEDEIASIENMYGEAFAE